MTTETKTATNKAAKVKPNLVLRDILPSAATVHPSKGLFSPKGAIENVFMETSWRRTAVMAVDKEGNVFCAQSAGSHEFDFVVSSVDVDGAKTPVMVGNNLQNIMRWACYGVDRWRVVTVGEELIVDLPKISPWTKIDGED